MKVQRQASRYDRRSIERDTAIKAALAHEGIETVGVNGSLLFEPWTVETGQGAYYKVFTPFWRAVRSRPVAGVEAPPNNLMPPALWPRSENLADWALGAAMNRGAAVVVRHAQIGEVAAAERLDAFVAEKIGAYAERRNFFAEPATSGLAENLNFGEISPARVWHAGWKAMEAGAKGAEQFLKELVWREFAHHLIFHSPHIEFRNWRTDWDGFPWRSDNDEAERWRRGMTGIPLVDAAMRQLYVTGRMHNRARMVVASFLTKHLLTDWRVGADWFRNCLIDWDPAANALGWQWSAGSGPDATPYFRIFNPESQAEKFDPESQYRDRYLAEGRKRPHADALAFFDAVPRSWNLSPDRPYPTPVIGLAEGRARALDAYQAYRKR